MARRLWANLCLFARSLTGTLLDDGHETIATAVHGLYDLLLSSTVTNGFPYRHDATAQGCLADVLVGPHVPSNSCFDTTLSRRCTR